MNREAGRASGALLAAVVLLAAGCAPGEITPAAAPATATTAGRAAPDDDDLLGVIPDGAETVIEVDVAQLRASAWSRGLLAVPDAERASKSEAQGFDEVTDVDRAVFAVSETAAGPATLSVAQGRFDPPRLDRALHDGWTRGSWRGSRIWERGDRAQALLTARTLITGEPAAVRTAIDCAWALAPDVRHTGVGQLAREQSATGARPAVTAAAMVTEAMRKRVASQFELPAGLERAGGRLALGAALDLELVGLLVNERQASDTAHNLEILLRDLRARRALAVFGITPFLSGVTVAPQGKRVRIHMVLPEDKREDLAAKIAFVLETIGARRP